MSDINNDNLARCWVCQKPHAKRKCSATNFFICSLCCGSKRKKEIDCPDECQYLLEVRSHWVNKLQLDQPRIDFWRSHFDVLNNINFALLKLRKNRLSNLNNNELKEAIENLIRTYETEERGIIYEYKSANYRIQSVFDGVQEIVNRHRNTTAAQNTRQQSAEIQLRKVSLDEIVQCIKFIQGILKQIIIKNMSDNSYFDFIAYFTSSHLIDDTR